METTAQFTRDLGIDLPFSGIGDTAVQSGRPAGKPPVSVTVFEAARGPTSTAVTPPWGAIILDFSALDIAKIIAAIGKQHAVVLSEPRLVTSSGRPASFLAGGEIPFQKATDSTTRFREFGVQLNFVPTIVGKSLIRLKVEVEVDVGALGAEGGNSGLAGRRASTQVQMRAGQTLVVGGLLTDPVTVKQDRVPFFADIPAVGSLFQRKERSATMKSRLLIFVTAELAR